LRNRLLWSNDCIVFVGEFEKVKDRLLSLVETACRERKQVGVSSVLDLGFDGGVSFFVKEFLFCKNSLEDCLRDTLNLLQIFLKEEEKRNLETAYFSLLKKIQATSKEKRSLLFVFRDFFVETFPASYKELLVQDLITNEVIGSFETLILYDVKFEVEIEAVREAVSKTRNGNSKVSVVKWNGEEIEEKQD